MVIVYALIIFSDASLSRKGSISNPKNLSVDTLLSARAIFRYSNDLLLLAWVWTVAVRLLRRWRQRRNDFARIRLSYIQFTSTHWWLPTIHQVWSHKSTQRWIARFCCTCCPETSTRASFCFAVLFLDVKWIDLNAINQDQENALHHLLVRYCKSKNLILLIRLLVEIGMDMKAKTKDGNAVAVGCIAVLIRLIRSLDETVYSVLHTNECCIQERILTIVENTNLTQHQF